MPDKLLTIKQTAKELGVSTKTIRRWEDQGKIESIRTSGGHRRFRLKEVAPKKVITPKKLLPYIVITFLLSSGLAYFLTRNFYAGKMQVVRDQLDSYMNHVENKEVVINNSQNTTIVDSGVSVIKPEDNQSILVSSKEIVINSQVHLSSVNPVNLEVSQVISGIGFIVSSDEQVTSPTYFNWEVSN